MRKPFLTRGDLNQTTIEQTLPKLQKIQLNQTDLILKLYTCGTTAAFDNIFRMH